MIGNTGEYRAMAACERTLWWYRSLHRLTLQKLRDYRVSLNACVLDAGCGTGGMLSLLKEQGFRDVSGFDLSPDAIAYAAKNYQLDVKLLNILQCDAMYEPGRFDVIISHDVLCLLTPGQDLVALEKLERLLKPGGLLLMNLPAGKAFRGTHDIAVRINKRYSPNEIRQLANGIIEMREWLYWPFILSFLIFPVRFIQRVSMIVLAKKNIVSDVALPLAPLNRFFNHLTQWENLRMRNKPWGSSIFVVMQKPVE